MLYIYIEQHLPPPPLLPPSRVVLPNGSSARITTFALEATIHQLRADGYSVFVVRGGELPPVAAGAPGEGPRNCWYRVKDLLEVAKGKGG